MWWGTWILVLVYPALLAAALVLAPAAMLRLARAEAIDQQVGARPAVVRAMAWGDGVLGVALGIYTGMPARGTRRPAVLEQHAKLGPLFLLLGCPRRPRGALSARSAEPLAWLDDHGSSRNCWR